MRRDPSDCICPGATRKTVTDAKGRPVLDDKGQPRVEWQTNDPTVTCPHHPMGYDPQTGENG